MTKTLLTILALNAFIGISQINYTVDVLRLKAKADDCDGGSLLGCPNQPQDPIFNVWVTDADANENTFCWIYEDDNAASYDTWIDIQNVQVANVTNANATYISVEMSGFETDAVFSATCNAESGDDAIENRQLAQQFDISTIPMSTPYVAIVDIAGIYFAEVQIEWVDPSASIDELSTKVSVYPNPSEGELKFNINNNGNYQANIYDLSGRMALSTSAENGTTIQLSDLNIGTYLLELVNLEGVLIYREKIILR